MHFVHFVEDRHNPLPLCGDWRAEPSWTTFAVLVSCPFCLARLRERAARSSG